MTGYKDFLIVFFFNKDLTARCVFWSIYNDTRDFSMYTRFKLNLFLT